LLSPRPQKKYPKRPLTLFFYNALINYVYDQPDFNRDNLKQKIKEGITATNKYIIEASKGCVGIRLTAGAEVTSVNCPDRYKLLFNVLLSLKNKKNTDAELAHISQQIVALDSFQEINPAEFLLGAMREADAAQTKIHCDETGVTPKLIRATFYNEMVTQTFLAVKRSTDGMSDQDIEVVKQIAACDKELPDDLQRLKTRSLMESVGITKIIFHTLHCFNPSSTTMPSIEKPNNHQDLGSRVRCQLDQSIHRNGSAITFHN